MAKNRIFTAILSILVIIGMLTFSIGLPIYFRPFYYSQIESLQIPERTGYDKQAIIDAYNEVLDYLTVPGNEFGTGVFPYSESGKQHFEDCKVLFDLNGIMLLISIAAITALMLLKRKKVFSLARPFGSHYLMTCGASTLTLFVLIGLLASLDFDRAFTVFHMLFFPGKDNWIFDARVDGIILALPQEFFMNCAILIAASIILISIGFIVYGILEKSAKHLPNTNT